MKLFHARALRRTRLLALDALDADEADLARRHLADCATCRVEHQATTSLLAVLPRDEVRSAEPPLALQALSARVRARLDEAGAGERRTSFFWPDVFWLRPAWAVAAAAALAFATVARAPQPLPPAEAVTDVAQAGADGLLLPVDALQRLERGAARAQTARYLNEAQDVLVTVAARLPYCKRRTPRVEVAAEARRSRELLARRALMVEAGNGHVAAARGVLDDVERVLREVAAFEDCEPSGRVEELGVELDQRRLLMRMALMQRELAG